MLLTVLMNSTAAWPYRLDILCEDIAAAKARETLVIDWLNSTFVEMLNIVRVDKCLDKMFYQVNHFTNFLIIKQILC